MKKQYIIKHILTNKEQIMNAEEKAKLIKIFKQNFKKFMINVMIK